MTKENTAKTPVKEKFKNFFVRLGEVLKNFFINVWKDKSKFLLALSLVFVLVGAVFAYAVNTDWGKVKVSSFKLKTGDKTWVVADVYKPVEASADNKAPCVIVCPGYQRTKETQAAYNVELSRRGFAVICLDPYSQGESSTTDQTASSVGYGLFAIIEHVTQADENGNSVNFDYIDLNRVGIAGHSAGGNACIYAASKYATYDNQKIQAAYISGYVRNGILTDDNIKTLKNISCNMGIAYAKYDEGAYQNLNARPDLYAEYEIEVREEHEQTLTEKYRNMFESDSSLTEAEVQKKVTDGVEKEIKQLINAKITSLDYSDMRYARYSVNFVNSGIFAHEGSGENYVTEVYVDEYYGSPDDYSFRVVHNERTIHALQPYDNLSVAHMVEFFDYVFTNGEIEESGLSARSQVWWLKEIFQGFMLAGMFLFVLAEGALLLRVKFFATAVHEVQPMSSKDTKIDKLIFWGVFAVCAVFAMFAYKWSATLASKWFTTGPVENKGGLTWLFPQRMTNAVVIWSILNGLLGLGLFLLTHFLRHRKHGATLINLREKPTNVLKMLLLAFIILCSFYAVIDIVYLIFHVDPRFFFMCARPFFFSTNWRILVLALMYIPLFFLFYFTNSVRVNCSMRKARWGKVGSVVIACLANCLGLIGILGMQYIVFSATGTVWLTDTWLYVNMLWCVVPLMILLPIFNRYFYNKTGKIYLGPFVCCMIFVMMSMLNTVTYLPL